MRDVLAGSVARLGDRVMSEMTARDLRALAQLIDAGRVVVVRHDNLLAVLRPEIDTINKAQGGKER